MSHFGFHSYEIYSPQNSSLIEQNVPRLLLFLKFLIRRNVSRQNLWRRSVHLPVVINCLSIPGTLFATVVVEDANEAPVCLPINYHVTIPEADATLTGNFIQIQCFDEDSTTSGENFALLKYNIKSETQYPASTVITTDAGTFNRGFIQNSLT